MEQILSNPDIFTHSFCAFLSVRDLCCADVAVSSSRRLGPLLKTLFQSPGLRQQVAAMTENMTATEHLGEAQLEWLIQRGTPLRAVSLVPDTSDAALDMLSRHCASLTALDLAHCRELSAAGVTSLSRNCHSLTSLNLNYCKIDVNHLQCLLSLLLGLECRLSIRLPT